MNGGLSQPTARKWPRTGEMRPAAMMVRSLGQSAYLNEALGWMLTYIAFASLVARVVWMGMK